MKCVVSKIQLHTQSESLACCALRAIYFVTLSADLREELEAAIELARQDSASLNAELDELRGQAAASTRMPQWQEQDGGARARIETLEKQVAELLELIEGQTLMQAELEELRPKYAKLERELLKVKGET